MYSGYYFLSERKLQLQSLKSHEFVNSISTQNKTCDTEVPQIYCTLGTTRDESDGNYLQSFCCCQRIKTNNKIFPCVVK